MGQDQGGQGWLRISLNLCIGSPGPGRSSPLKNDRMWSLLSETGRLCRRQRPDCRRKLGVKACVGCFSPAGSRSQVTLSPRASAFPSDKGASCLVHRTVGNVEWVTYSQPQRSAQVKGCTIVLGGLRMDGLTETDSTGARGRRTITQGSQRPLQP